MMHTSFINSATLSRSQTPNSTLSSANRPSPSPKCFGRNTHVLKEEYERERVRWQQKLEEAEQKLTEASINNSELFQIKAELNRKIIDFEKNQRPMIEQNRRLNERVRALNAEVKELEKKLAFAQDDFLSLRDSYDRLIKENSVLKEQRAFPEKLEELGRYRNQVLEYSKCITALRQSAVEKDKRYDMIVQKFRKYRKLLSTRRSESANCEDDRHSCIGSEGSMDSSMCLDTITEDLDEDMEFTADLLQSPLSTTAEFGLKQQLELANMTIGELQNAVECLNLDYPGRISEGMDRLYAEIKGLQEAKRSLETELANAQHNNELLEFQLTELTEGLQHSGRNDFFDKQCSTDVQIPASSNFTDVDFELHKRVNVSIEDAAASCDALLKVLHTNAAILHRDDFETIRKAVEIFDALQNQLSFMETDLNMVNCELNRVRRMSDEEISELRRQTEESATLKQQKKRELLAEIEHLKKEKKEDAKRFTKQIQELENLFEQKSKESAGKTDQMRALNGEIRMMSTKIENQSATIAANSSTISGLREQFEKLSDELSDAKSGVEMARKMSRDEAFRVEEVRRASTTQIDALKAENADLQLRSAQANEDAQEKRRVLEADFAARIAELEAELRESIENADAERADAMMQKRALEKELCDARAQIHTLKEQIRPIGTQLERRYEESRYRLSEALKKIHELEMQQENLLTTNGTGNPEYDQLRLRYAQSEAYNHELQDQFNAQLELMNMLKKEIITLKAKKSTQSTDSIGWTSNSSDGSNSMDDEQYHSESSTDPTATTNTTTTVIPNSK